MQADHSYSHAVEGRAPFPEQGENQGQGLLIVISPLQTFLPNVIHNQNAPVYTNLKLDD